MFQNLDRVVGLFDWGLAFGFQFSLLRLVILFRNSIFRERDVDVDRRELNPASNRVCNRLLVLGLLYFGSVGFSLALRGKSPPNEKILGP